MNLALRDYTLNATNPARDLPVLKHFTLSFLPENAARHLQFRSGLMLSCVIEGKMIIWKWFRIWELPISNPDISYPKYALQSTWYSSV